MAALISAFVALGLLTSLVHAQELAFEIVNPRPFGYVIGDMLERRITVATVQAPEALPKTGKVDGWLELRDIVVERDGRTELIFTYQLMNAPNEVKTLALPTMTLNFGGLQVSIPEWPFTASPITPEFVLARDELSEMRPDAPPRPISTRAAERRLTFYVIAVLCIVLWWALAKFGWRLSKRPFSRAYRRLRSLRTKDAYPEALKIVHRAFDETAGGVVFANELPKFFSTHPRFAAARDEAQKFFSLSRQEFFADNRHEGSLDWLISFCRSLSRLEAK
ncbi:MAG: hypothetical protein ACREV9_15835 [Burkholderiales bacterium]